MEHKCIIKYTYDTFSVEYTAEAVPRHCSEIHCEENELCTCSLCLCCSVCASGCPCPLATTDPNKKLAQLLGFGDANYRLATLDKPGLYSSTKSYKLP